jgi:thiamine-phosphate pyrophosphorylase
MKKPDALRIIDANFNRVREAIRVVEDIVRFLMNEKNLHIDLREIRHSFTFSYIKYFGSLPITKRDIFTDKGRRNQAYEATTLREILVRNFLRIEEGIRCIEECSTLVRPESTHVWQEIRFKIYEIERQILIRFPEKIIEVPFLGIRLPDIDVDKIKPIIEILIKKLINIIIVPVGENLTGFIKYIKGIKTNRIIILIEDRADIALITDADGVYLTQDTMIARDIRSIMPGKTIGMEIKSVKNMKIHKDKDTFVNFIASENREVISSFLTKSEKKSKLLVAGITRSHHEITNTLINGVDGVILNINRMQSEQTIEITNEAKKSIKDFFYGKTTRIAKE